MLLPSYPYILSHLQAGYPPCCGGSIYPPFRSLTSPFYVYLFQNFIFIVLYDWVILTGWTAIWLLLAAIAFFLLQTPRTKKAWWQYLMLLLVGALSIWTFMVASNSYQHWLYLNSLPLMHGNILRLPFYSMLYLTAIQSCQWLFTLAASVMVLLIVGAGWRLQRAFSRKLDLALGKYYGHLAMSLILAVIGLCGLALGIVLITQLYWSLIYAPQEVPFQFNEPTTLILIGLFIVCLGGPLILLLLSLAAFVERRKLGKLAASQEMRLPAMEMRSSQRT